MTNDKRTRRDQKNVGRENKRSGTRPNTKRGQKSMFELINAGPLKSFYIQPARRHGEQTRSHLWVVCRTREIRRPGLLKRSFERRLEWRGRFVDGDPRLPEMTERRLRRNVRSARRTIKIKRTFWMDISYGSRQTVGPEMTIKTNRLGPLKPEDFQRVAAVLGQ